MQTSEPDFAGALAIDSYGPGFFRVGGKVRRGGILIHAGAVQPWHGFSDTAVLTELAGLVDILFCGMGPNMAYLPADIVRTLTPLGIMCEPMTTPSAARTYNVLLSEGRRVGAALLPMPEA